MSLLYPIYNSTRTKFTLDGMWNFKFDPKDIGSNRGWEHGLSDSIDMPVPASFNDFFTDKESRDYTGVFWYEKTIFVENKKDKDIILRFSSATHYAEVFVNGESVGAHRGGFIPFELDLTDTVERNEQNRISVKMNNLLSHQTLPAGTTETLSDGRVISKPYFDFFNYAGLQRSIHLLYVPKTRIVDFDTTYELKADHRQAMIHYKVYTNNEKYDDVKLSLYDQEGKKVDEVNTSDGKIIVENPRLWKVLDSYLYTLKIQLILGEEIVDEYAQEIGIRTVEIEGTNILVNNEPVYLKGYGKHEDSDIAGRGFSQNVMKRDFELLKWSGANSFRAAHYPYSEEMYQMADKEGFLVIDEVAAVGFFESLLNFFEASSGASTNFFEDHKHLEELKQNHIDDVQDLIQRDKNHPSVIAWCLLNEPDSTNETAGKYIREIFETAKKFDPQKRPRTYTLIMMADPKTDTAHQYSDFISLNRYYGWYSQSGSNFTNAYDLFKEEMDKWAQLNLNKPFVISEYGADTYVGETKLPSVMWSEQYQDEYLDLQHEIFDAYNFIIGEHIWNFTDFQTTEGLMRVNGNKKGVFTRQRQPKRIAYKLKERWENMS